MVLEFEHHQSPDPAFLLTVVATLSNSELRLSLAFSALARLISKRTRLPSRTNSIMPPRFEKPGMSLTVRTLASSIAARISFKCFSSVELMNRMRQPAASCGFAIRLITTGLLSSVSPARVESRVMPKGSAPSTQAAKDWLLSAEALEGHFTNLPKLSRY